DYIVSAAGEVTLSFEHRHSFEREMWDAGQLWISVNGDDYTDVGKYAFSKNGYTDAAIVGNGIAKGQYGFGNASAGYANGSYITTTASLGSFDAGDAISVRFVALYDDCATGVKPNWVIASVSSAIESVVQDITEDFAILPLDAVSARKGTGLDGRYWQAGVNTINNLRDNGLKIITGSHPTATFRATHLTYQGGNDLTTARKWLTLSRTYVGYNGNMDDGILSFTGYIRIDTPPRGIAPGEVAIRSESDDGSMVWIAGTKVVDNDGRHDAPGPTPDGTYNFHTPGFYPIEIAWFNSDSINDAGDHGDASLNVLVNGNPIPKGVLYSAADVRAVAIAASSITEGMGDAGLAGAYWHTEQAGLEFGEGPRVNS
ncbi:uncharacterized protein METZ01_LOCUS310019, partial [marine metagenome]